MAASEITIVTTLVVVVVVIAPPHITIIQRTGTRMSCLQAGLPLPQGVPQLLRTLVMQQEEEEEEVQISMQSGIPILPYQPQMII